MIFNSFNFLILYPLIFLGYYLIPFQRKRFRNYWCPTKIKRTPKAYFKGRKTAVEVLKIQKQAPNQIMRVAKGVKNGFLK